MSYNIPLKDIYYFVIMCALITFSAQGWYRWSDNWPVSYANWGAREPTRNPDDGCVAMMADGKWNSTVCSFQLPSVCVKRQGTK